MVRHYQGIDWSGLRRMVDPAYDLAIVTRGNFKLFGCQNGIRKLVDRYREADGIPISVEDVVNHEILLVPNWLWEAVQRQPAGKPGGHGPEQYRNQLHGLLRRAPPKAVTLKNKNRP